jgi:cytochrome oxidase Cu insertion factor (SCO1/SenC/PrrC family)
MKPHYLRIFFMTIALGATALYTYGVMKERKGNPQPTAQVIEGAPQVGGPFALKDLKGQTKTQEDLKGRYAAVYFGYTFCPDICPMAMHGLTQALKQVGPLAEKIQPVFVSIDPERDGPSEIGAYLTQFDPRFLGLYGDKKATQQAVDSYKVYAVKQPSGHGSEHYVMDHSSIIYIMGPDGAYIGHFTHATPVDEMVRDLKVWVK